MMRKISGLYNVFRGLFGRRGGARAGTGREDSRSQLDKGITRVIKEYREVFERLEKYDRS